MASITVDIILLLPPDLRQAAVEVSAALASGMAAHGHPSAFTLGDACEPHVSLFMLRVDEDEIGQVIRGAEAVAARSASVTAHGTEYRHNPVGAPELHLARTPSWTALQDGVVREIEPLRRGRLRDADPAGADLAAVVDDLRRREPGGARLRHLLACGYDEIGELFSPHITFAWPVDEQPSPMDGLPAAASWHGSLNTLAVYGMGSHGTCVTPYASFGLAFVAGEQEQDVGTGLPVPQGVALRRAGRP